MTDRKLLEQALESLQTILGYRQTFLDIHQVMEDLKARLGQPDFVPRTEWVQIPDMETYFNRLKEFEAQRKWHGLTDKEHEQIAIDCGCASADWVFYGAAVERKLREKNT